MLTSSSPNSIEYFEGSFSPKSTTSQPSSLLSTLKLESASGTATKFPEIITNHKNVEFLGTMTNPLGMTLKPPPEDGGGNSGGGATSGSGGSRLDRIQAQYRQKLESEKETKLREIFEKSRQDADRRIERITGGVAATRSTAKPSPSALNNGDAAAHTVSSGGMMKDFFKERRNLEMNGGQNPTGLPTIQTHLKNKRREFQQQQRQQQQQQPDQQQQETGLKPPRHQSKRSQLAPTRNNKPLSPIAAPPPMSDLRQAKNDGNGDGFNSTYSLSSSTLHPGDFPPSPDSLPVKDETPQGGPKMLLPPVRTKKTRSPVASPRKQNGAGAAGSPPRMAPVKRPAKGRQKATKAENMKAENMKFLDKILEAERRKSAERRRLHGGNDAALGRNGGSGDAANCTIKRREDEIMRQINQKMAELDRLRTQNRDLGDRSRGSSRGETPVVDRFRQAGEDEPFHEAGEDVAPHDRTDDAAQASAASRRGQRRGAASGGSSGGDGRHVDLEGQMMMIRKRATTTSTSATARGIHPSDVKPPSSPPSSSSTEEVDAFRSRPRVGVEEATEKPISEKTPRQMQRQQQRRQQPRQQQPQDTAVDPTGREVALVEEELPVGQIRGGKGAVGVEEEAEEVVDVRLVECGNCGRRFAEDRVAKHEKTCSSVKTRKPYDTKKHRVMGADHESYALNPKYQKEEPKKKSNWRGNHEEFIRNIREARGASKGGAPPAPAVNPDYIQCPHCQRRFNESAAERHIPKCKDLKTKMVGQKSSAGASSRTIAKPPSNTRRR